MKKNLLVKFGQYKCDIFHKLNFSFKRGNSILDVGCGDGVDAEIFIKVYGLKVYALDVFKHENIRNIKSLKFTKGSIFKLPFEDKRFDYVFIHDVLHHIDEKTQSTSKHLKALAELERVCKKGGTVIIIEANRFNPLTYPHMVLMMGHNHFRQSYFVYLLNKAFVRCRFKYFEAHFYPQSFLGLFKVYEKFMELQPFKGILNYNTAFIEAR